MVAGAIGTIVTFTLLTYGAVGLFTGAGIFVAWALAWAMGMVAANLATQGSRWKRELLIATVLAVIVVLLNVAFFKGWLWWYWWSS